MTMSGISWDATIEQQASELKRLTKSSRLKMCGKAGVKQKLHVDKKPSHALRLQTRVSYHTFHKRKKMRKKVGVSFESEKKEKDYQKDLLGDQLEILNCDLQFKDEKKESGIDLKETPVVGAKNLTTFVMN